MSGDWTIAQDWARYTPAEHAMWDRLFQRQVAMLPGRAVPEFLSAIDVLRMSRPGIPDFAELSERLNALTGWQVVAVPGLVPDEIFFEHLANRRFIAGRFIRRPDQIDYLEEPDVFHDVFGHVPLLANPVFADYMQAFGAGGLRAAQLGRIEQLSRLYWYTVEFGLIRRDGNLAIFGAGIVSSFGESRFALDSLSPNHIGFDLARIMRTRYRIDDFQQSYFVIDSFEQLLRATLDTDFAPLYETIAPLPELASDAVEADDSVLQRGTQEHARAAASS